MQGRLLVVATGVDNGAAPHAFEHTIDRVAPLVVLPRFAEMKAAMARLASYRTIAMTSAHAVDALVGALRALGHDVRALFGIQLAVVGAATAARLERYGLSADLVADGGGEKLAQEILASACADPILYPRAADGHPALVDALTAAGRRIDPVAAYETRPDAAAIKTVLMKHAERPYAAFAFASPKGVNAISFRYFAFFP